MNIYNKNKSFVITTRVYVQRVELVETRQVSMPSRVVYLKTKYL